ncbi:unnamed protein product [Mytilus edulis]|uniref:Uncharacterized protein n=1 Tax=Mytilus edulis TaxID=6550 RepID=A0A8S3UB61_MYTED|nr:unnamed protein product [Mytilus edulis]
MVKFLVEKGANINYVDCSKQSILGVAISKNIPDIENILEFLLENGADINHENINGQSDFMYLMDSDKLTYRYLLDVIDSVSNVHEKNYRTGGSFLHITGERVHDKNRVDMLKKLLKMGLDVDFLDNNDDSPLHVMCGIACYSSIMFLLANGADIKARNRLGETVLHYLACSNEFDGYSESLKLLIDSGVDINELDYAGRTCVHHSLLSKDTTPKAVKELIKYGVKINVQDCLGQNEISFAVQKVDLLEYTEVTDFERRCEVIKMLSQENVDINNADIYGITPLHLSTTFGPGDLDILVTLLDIGVDVTRKTKTGATALHWACKVYNMAHVLIFTYRQNGYNVDVTDKYGSTALHWAVWYRNVQACQSLLQYGADVNIQDMAGKTAIDLATTLHFDDFHSLLTTYETMESLELQEPVLKCNGRDPIFCCPLLKYIRKENDIANVEEYIEHVNRHKISLCKSINIVLGSSNMGMFYEIEENITVPEKIDNLMQLLSARVTDKNKLFRCELRLAGSSLEGTKVRLRDEFDYLWCLKEFGVAFVPVESIAYPESFVKLRLKDDRNCLRFSHYINHENFLDCKLLTRHLYSLLNEEIKNILKDQIDFVCLKFLNEISHGTSSLVLCYFGCQAKSFPISIDVVPTVWFNGWTPVEFPVGQSHLLHDNSNDLMFSVVFKTPDMFHVKDYTTFYRISYAYIEQNILKSIPFHIKKGYIILKSLCETGYFPKTIDHDKNRTLEKYITTYHLKTCFLHDWKMLNEGTIQISRFVRKTP